MIIHHYPHDSITCNGRTVCIAEILNNSASARDSFESDLFNFIRRWLSGTDSFSLATSGSTGAPKEMRLLRRQMEDSAQMTATALNLRQGQRALVCLSAAYVAGKMMIVRSLECGMSIVAVSPSSNPMLGVEGIVDFTAMVPLQVHDMLHTTPGVFNQLRTLIIGGGALSPEDIQLLANVPCRCFATYGMTETVSHVALRQLNGAAASPYYTALPGVRFALDARGCLVIHWKTLGDPVVTNDLVDLADESRFVWLGRWDNVINSGGIKIVPEVLEANMQKALSHAGFHQRFFLSSVSDPRLGNKMVMVIEDPYMSTSAAQTREILKASLAPHEIPREFLSCSRFLETETGKINRNSSLELAISELNSTR